MSSWVRKLQTSPVVVLARLYYSHFNDVRLRIANYQTSGCPHRCANRRRLCASDFYWKTDGTPAAKTRSIDQVARKASQNRHLCPPPPRSHPKPLPNSPPQNNTLDATRRIQNEEPTGSGSAATRRAKNATLCPPPCSE